MGKALSPDQIVQRVRDAASPVVSSFGLGIWGIELVPGGRTVVRLYVDVPAHAERPAGEGCGTDGAVEGVSVDRCAEISRLLGLALDVDGIFSNAWVLEVSSPGFDRMFFDAAQLSAYVGSNIDVTLQEPHPEIEGRRKFRGPLGGVSGERFAMEVLVPPAPGEKPEPVQVTIAWSMVKKARLVPAFSNTSRPGAKKTKQPSGKGGKQA